MNPLKSRVALILALLLAAPPAAIRADETPVGGSSVGANEKAGINALATLIKDGGAAKIDVAARFASYLLTQKDGKPLYIQVGDKPGDQAAVDAITKAQEGDKPSFIGVWVNDEKNAGAAAALFYVMGAGDDLPAWARGKPGLEALTHKVWREVHAENLARRMELFAVNSARTPEWNPAQRGVSCSQYSGPFKGTAPDKWTPAFLVCAAEYAAAIINDPRVKAEVARRIKENEERLNPPGTPESDEARRRRGAPAFSSAFDTDGLYKHGGVSHPVSDGKPGEYITVKMYSEKAGEGMQSRAAFFHVIPSADAYGNPKITWTALKVGENVLDGYKIVVKDDGSVTVASTGAGGSSFSTTRATLEQKRAELVASPAASEDTLPKDPPGAGRRYRIIGQGGHPGSYLYFPINEDGKTFAKDPSHRGDVAEMRKNANGTWSRYNLDGPQALGNFGTGKDRKHYNLVWNQEQRYWEAKAGDAPKPPEPKPEDPAKPPTDGGTTGGRDGGTTPERRDGAAAPAYSLLCNRDVPPNHKKFTLNDWSFIVDLGGGQNQFYLCLNDNQLLGISGVLVEGGIGKKTVGDKEFITVTLVPPGDKPAGEGLLRNGQIPTGEIGVTKAGQPSFMQKDVYYIPASNLGSTAITNRGKKKGADALPGLDEVASYRVRFNLSEPDKAAMISASIYDAREQDGAFKSTVLFALQKFEPGNPSAAAYGSDAKFKQKLDQYLDSQAAVFKSAPVADVLLGSTMNVTPYVQNSVKKVGDSQPFIVPSSRPAGAVNLHYCWVNADPSGALPARLELGPDHDNGAAHALPK